MWHGTLLQDSVTSSALSQNFPSFSGFCNTFLPASNHSERLETASKSPIPCKSKGFRS